MNKRYLIFWRYAHSVIYLVQAETVTEAVWKFIANQDDGAIRQVDGSVVDGRAVYPHPLAYIEAHYKANPGFEWQIREVPDWALQDQFNELFCGESQDGPGMVIADCRKSLAREFPRSRARAFVWYVRGGGAVVSFYRRQGPWRIAILQRYFHHWDGEKLTVEAWSGDYAELINILQTEPLRWRWPVRT